MVQKKRRFISIYFKNGNQGSRKKKDVTISFEDGDLLYEKCCQLGSSNIKRIIGVDSYQELVKKAKEEERPLSNFIKFILKKHFFK